ncbi:endonuclease/exonuclease/phosphatase family protein [Pseudoxanthomonas sp. PXM02]|nr:endonuclease/exonuclease/phosphatase family protein [Pseudoxanthomonas sp. PXM02]
MPGQGSLGWALDLFAHWQPLYVLAWLIACGIGALRDRRWLLCLPLLALPWFTASPKAPRSEGPPDLVMAVANVNIRQRDPAALLAWLQHQPADIVVLTELSPDYADPLARRSYGGFAHRALHPLVSPPGLGILSDRPLHDVRLVEDRLGALRMEAGLDIDGHRVRFVAAHPKPPMATRKYRARDKLMRELAVSATNEPMIVAGDLNATPWSSALLGADMRALRRTTGGAPTYPSEGAGVFGIGIDHVLVSSGFAQTGAERGPDIGSDHLPVRVGLRWQGE